MSVRPFLVAALLSTLGSVALASGGSNDPFKTEVDCLGTWAPGDVVAYTVQVEDRVGQRHPIDYTFEVVDPTGRAFTLRDGRFTITPNQDLVFDRTLRVPASAMSGRYSLVITSHSPTWSFTDTCSFHVQ